MERRNSLNVSDIIDSLVQGLVCLKRNEVTDFTRLHHGIVVPLAWQTTEANSLAHLADVIKDCLFGSVLNEHITLEVTSREYAATWPITLAHTMCHVIPGYTANQVDYACALAVQIGAEEVIHLASGNRPKLRHASQVSTDSIPAVWYDVMRIGPESLISIHADSHLAFPGTPRVGHSCTLWRGYRGEVAPIPLADDEFITWWKTNEATQYFKNRASDRQCSIRVITCRNENGGVQ